MAAAAATAAAGLVRHRASMKHFTADGCIHADAMWSGLIAAQSDDRVEMPRKQTNTRHRRDPRTAA